jgi:dipeptidyl aminopeptidase/acylaminoacyl peptidase
MIAETVVLVLAAAQAQARPMTESDVARLENVNEIAVAPDGSRIAFTTLWRPDVTKGEDDGVAQGQLMVTLEAGKGRPFLPRSMDVGRIGFSPDGALISFVWAEPEGNSAVWGIPVDGGAERKLAEVADSRVLDYAWAPDGATLYLLADAGADLRRRRLEQAGFDASVFEEEHHFNRLFAARLGSQIDPAPREIRLPGFVDGFRVSRDGRFAAVDSAPTPLTDDDRTSKRVQLVELASGKVLARIPTHAKLGDVEISPDGARLALIAGADQHDPGKTTLYLYDIAGETLAALNPGAAESAEDAEWLDDGRLATVIHVGVRSVLRFYDAQGALQEEVDPGPLVLHNIETAGGRLVVRANSPTHPDELFLLDGSRLVRWTSHNPWLAEIDFGHQRSLTYAARDGQAIEGILIEPVGGARRRGSPTIIDVHGGPEAHESNGWLTSYSGPGQIAAGRGFAVFLPNYRGSTGYGVDFSKQHQGDYAGREFDDLVDAKRFLVDAGVADPDRVGMTGGSYGGFATAWAATAESAEFAAAVMFAGITDQISKWGTTDIPTEMVEAHALRYPWEDWRGFLEDSPVFHAGTAATPLLILHGTQDARVPATQAQELYRAIRTRTNTPVRLVLYPKEGHGLRRAASRLDFNVRMMEWFETYLRGERDTPRPPPRPDLSIDPPDGEKP